jgi:hypothetical protein
MSLRTLEVVQVWLRVAGGRLGYRCSDSSCGQLILRHQDRAFGGEW